MLAAMFVSSGGFENVASDPNLASLLCLISKSKIAQTPLTHQEIFLAVDLPVDVIKCFPSQPPP